MANGKNTKKASYTTMGAMPANDMSAKVISEILKATGVKKHVMRTATTITVPLALLTLCMLPSIMKALSVLSGIISVGIAFAFGYRILSLRGMTPEAPKVLGESRHRITAEELAARKAKAYSFAEDGATDGANSMTVN